MIISTKEIFEGRNASYDLDGWNREYTRQYFVRTDTNENEWSVLASTATPVPGITFHPQDTQALCIGKKVDEVNASLEGHLWKVTTRFSTQWPVNTEEDPLARDVEISLSYQQEQVPMLVDLDDEKIVNSADDPFENPPERTVSILKFTLTKNYEWESLDLEWLDGLKNTVNDATWWTVEANHAKMDSISFSVKREQATKFAEVKFDILIDYEKPFHPTRILDAGYRDVSGRIFRADDGSELRQPKLLASDGFALPEDADPEYREFRFFVSADWSDVPVPV